MADPQKDGLKHKLLIARADRTVVNIQMADPQKDGLKLENEFIKIGFRRNSNG